MKFVPCIAAFLAFGAPSVAPQEDLARKLIDQADASYSDREKEGKAQESVALYKKAIAIDEGCVEAYWKIAQALYWVGPHTSGVVKQLEVFQEGIDFAKMAVALDEKCVPAHFWLGVLYGMYGQAKGVLQSLHMVDPIKREMERVIKLDEKFENGGAHRVLGRLYFRLPALNGGDLEKSKEHLKRAIEIGPGNLLSHLYLGDTYLEEENISEAIACYKKVLELPFEPRWTPENKEQKEEAKTKLKELGKG